MAYRMDWQVTLRAIRRRDVERLMGQLQETIGEGVQIHGQWPSRRFHSCWNCRFSTQERDLPFAEAVVQSMQLAQRLGEVWQFTLADRHGDRLTGLFTDERSPIRMIGLARAAFTLVPAQTPLEQICNIPDIDSPAQASYTVVIHNEESDEACDPADCSSLVYVEFADGTGWSARFFTLRSIETQVRRILNRNGRYFWDGGMILVEELTRPAVEAAIADLIEQGTFQQAFDWYGSEDWPPVECELSEP